MKQLTLNIPENKYELFIDFIKNIEFIKDYNELTNDVSNKEQEIILNRNFFRCFFNFFYFLLFTNFYMFI